jgi:ParB/RepB/Spo0J family partition protein
MTTTKANTKAKPQAKPPVATAKSGTEKGAGTSMIERMQARTATLKLNQATGEREILVPLDKIRFDPLQPRKAFHTLDGRVEKKYEDYIAELAASIKEQELIEAITVQEMPDGTYLVVVGECRTRAHLLNKSPTIRAIVRNDLTNPALRLLYQITENVARMDLSDEELSSSIMKLMEGDTEAGVPKMNQVQIAAKLGKSEGWVSRFVKFGDAEVQRVWYVSGIGDTVENVYRLTILPKAIQAEIIRRAALPESDPEALAKPLTREVIDNFGREAKLAKRQVVETPAAVAASHKTPAQTAPGPTWPFPDEAGTGKAGGENPANSSIRQAMTGTGNGASSERPAAPGSYTLSPEARANILSTMPSDDSEAASRNKDLAPPVRCQVTARNVGALIARLQDAMEGTDDFEAGLSIRCELNIPGDVAKVIANLLAGYIVPEQEIAAVLQSQLSALDLAAN